LKRRNQAIAPYCPLHRVFSVAMKKPPGGSLDRKAVRRIKSHQQDSGF
jgi:hypothetical protein